MKSDIFGRTDNMLVGLIKEMMENTRKDGENLTLQYVDFSKPYPHVCNIRVLSLPPGMMVITYWEDTNTAISA